MKSRNAGKKTRIESLGTQLTIEVSNLPRPELVMKVADAEYSSLYNYESLSAQDRACNIVHSNNKVCQTILITFRSIREGFTALNMAGHTKKDNLKCQARIDDALASIGMPIAKGMTALMDNDECPHGLVYDVSSVESDNGYSSTGCSTYDEDDVRT